MRNLTLFTGGNVNPFRLFDELERDLGKTIRFVDPSIHFENMHSRSDHQVIEKDTHYVLSLDVPGVSKSDISLETKEGQLKIVARRKNRFSDNEKPNMEYERTFTLPEGTDESKIEARCENGVLAIAIPKKEEIAPRKIEISEGKKDGLWGRLLNVAKSEDNKIASN